MKSAAKIKNCNPSISVAIPVKNGYPEIKKCIEGILKQTIPVEEIIVVDSGSTDKTLEYLKSIEEVNLIQIHPEEFNHGETRNIFWRECRTEFIVYTVQDAKPVNNDWLATLLSGFIDPQVVAVCGQQVVPHDIDKNPVEWFRPLSEPKLVRYQMKSDEFASLPATAKMSMCGWDDVNVMYRTAILRKTPFQSTVFGEDMIWARDALGRGHAIVYNYAARVYHYHSENKDFTFKRAFTTMYQQFKLFGCHTQPPKLTMKKRLSILKTLVKSSGLSPRNTAKWYLYNLEKYRGTRSAYNLFVKSLAMGEHVLQETHDKLCNKPPVPVKSYE